MSGVYPVVLSEGKQQMTRWVLGLAIAAVATTGCASHAPATEQSLPVGRAGPRELNIREQSLQVLNRLAFGPRPGDVDSVMAYGVDRWVDRQLHPERIPDRADELMTQSYPTLAMSSDELLRDFPPPGAALLKARARGDSMLTPAERAEALKGARGTRTFVGELLSAKVARAVTSDRQLQEVMTDFWENHFTVFVGKNQVRYAIPDYDRETIRPHALGKFRDLLGAVAKSPAMLNYLDNAQSVADSGRRVASDERGRGRGRRPIARRRGRGLNENYARELLELHTLGVDGGYTQEDVINVARALTGWTVRPPRQGRYGFVFNAAAHDAEPKVVLGHHLKGGRGIEDGEEVLDIVARHPSTATFIARKLAIRLVSDTPPGTLVERAAATFRQTDGDIRAVVHTIVTSPEFFSRQAYRTKVKSPFEVVVSALRALGASADTTPRTAAMVAQLGQPIFGHQAPNGWPETGESWMNTGAILNRINFGLAVAAGRVPGASLTRWPAYAGLVRQPPAVQVDSVIATLLGGQVSAATRSILETGRNPFLERAASDSVLSDHALDAAMEDMNMRNDEGGAERVRRVARPLAGRPVALTGLAQMVGLALGSPEFQRR
ncbi:MAG: DUF1800 domain-containing protein [Gemmatimonadaceae bacterium]